MAMILVLCDDIDNRLTTAPSDQMLCPVQTDRCATATGCVLSTKDDAKSDEQAAEACMVRQLATLTSNSSFDQFSSSSRILSALPLADLPLPAA